MNERMKLTVGLLVTSLVVVGLAAVVRVAAEQPEPVVDVAAITEAADALAQAQREISDIDRTIDRRTGERADAADDPEEEWCNNRGRRCAERKQARLDWLDDAIQGLNERRASAVARRDTAQTTLEGLGGSTLGERITELEEETVRLERRLEEDEQRLDHVESALEGEIARVSAQIPTTTTTLSPIEQKWNTVRHENWKVNGASPTCLEHFGPIDALTTPVPERPASGTAHVCRVILDRWAAQ